MTTFTARALSTDRLQKTIVQTDHMFIVGDLVINKALSGPPDYVLAQADSVANCSGTMMVSLIIDANTFVATQVGYVSNIAAHGLLTPGAFYYLSAAAANVLDAIPPSSTGQVILGLLKADSANSGFFFGGSGTEVEPSDVFSVELVSMNTTMDPNKWYICQQAGPGDIELTIPATYNKDDTFNVILDTSASNFVIKQTAATTQIFDLGLTTTLGNTGTITSTIEGNVIQMVALVDDGKLRTINTKGALTYA